jgi:hypothetical protein
MSSITVKRNKAQGRKVQSKIAKMTGGKSVGTIEGQDVSYHDRPLSVEVKHRKSFVAHGWMEQAERNAPEGKIPVVIVHTKNTRYDKSLVLMRFKDWMEWNDARYNDVSR